jgi:hypothetical protein
VTSLYATRCGYMDLPRFSGHLALRWQNNKTTDAEVCVCTARVRRRYWTQGLQGHASFHYLVIPEPPDEALEALIGLVLR